MATTTMTHEQAEQRAHRNFYIHAAAYAGVNSVLAYIDLTNSPDRMWFYWPLAGWGVGLALHAVSVFVTHKAADRVLARQEHRAERQERREQRREERHQAHV
ncbi:2TM domain-containing protein [Planctomicrobium piriforme]|uniref:2TM domain-containing protein n=1 Tax=Planctomicrobium piriforme TaxID=1576369 RepID=A0A1I3GWY6_9PLAN|nr:2TM domain-containing protein [Planctomicrobium piriforme]SFI28108.1 2TM domain-containing protein [Planctomicrobium piriforme]